MAKIPSSQRKGPGFDLFSGNYIPHAATKNFQSVAKDPTCHN